MYATLEARLLAIKGIWVIFADVLLIASNTASRDDMLAIVSAQGRIFMDGRIFSGRELGAFLRQARRQRGLTQAELAQRANVARSAVQKLEGGRGTVNLDTVLKLLTALSLDLVIASRGSAHHALGDLQEP